MRLPLTAIAGFGVVVLLAACGTDGADVIPTPVPELPLATVEPTSTPTVEIQPTLTPTFEVPKLLPTALPFPTRMPSATRTPVPSTAAQPANSVDGERAQPLAELSERMAANAFDFLTSFTEDHSPRASGTDQEKAAAEFLAARLRGLGYDVELQSFTVDIIPRDVPFLSLTSPEDRTFRGIPFTFSGEGEVEAPRVFV